MIIFFVVVCQAVHVQVILTNEVVRQETHTEVVHGILFIVQAIMATKALAKVRLVVLMTRQIVLVLVTKLLVKHRTIPMVEAVHGLTAALLVFDLTNEHARQPHDVLQIS